jgi:meiotically up-regulated gene 157 (Mug157) protein
MFGYVRKDDPIYQNTRRFVLSKENPYYMSGSVMNAYVTRGLALLLFLDLTHLSTGGPHVGFGMAWPMSLIVRVLTSDNDKEIYDSIKQILSSTDGIGLIHESVNASNAHIWTRQW